jgi:glycosyltransferase involved in cell wall biosynthesis
MARIPLLLMGDSPSASTGLGRITRELTIRIHENLSEIFRVGTYGLGGIPSRRFGWKQYQITKLENWAPTDLPRVWRDFAGDEKGIIFPIWNPSSLVWLADPSKLAPGMMKDFLESEPFERWLYAPIDADGPNGLMPQEVADVIVRFDRPLLYTKWASDLLQKTNGFVAPHLPHGTDTKIFYPRGRQEMRKTFVGTVTGGQPMPMKDDVFLVGIVATNSARKDWNLGLEVCGELLKRGVNVGVWAHTNKVQGYWDITGLSKAYGLDGRIIPTVTDLTDEQMAEAYCACNATLGIGSEGWGLPLAESLACGIPCVTMDYAGATEFVPREHRVNPIGFYAEGWYAHRRPVFKVSEWAYRVQEAVSNWDYSVSALRPEFTWDGCWPAWKKWLEEGVNG